jgi:hypothetical protein
MIHNGLVALEHKFGIDILDLKQMKIIANLLDD